MIFAIGVCIIAIFLYDVADDTGRFGDALILRLAVVLVSVLIAIPVVTVIHEGGHLVFGLLSGYKFSSFRIMSFMWVKEDGRIKFRRFSLAGTGGQCLMSPPPLVDGKMPVMLYNLGGTILNAISAVVGFIIFLAFPDFIIVPFIVFSLLFALTNGVPIHTAMIDNDGYNAISLGKNSEAMRGLWTQLSVADAQSRSIKLRDMPKEWFYMPDESAMDNGIVAASAVFFCNRLFDEGRFDEADKRMQDILSGENSITGLHRNLLICDRIFCELVGECRLSEVDRLMNAKLKKFMVAMKSFPSIIRTEYVYALLYERNESKAEQIRQRFAAKTRKYPYKADIEAELELMDIALRRYEDSLHSNIE